jgi:hypothetical protein
MTITTASTKRPIRRRAKPTLRSRRTGAAAGLFVLRLDFADISAIAPQLKNYQAGSYHDQITPISIDVNFTTPL